MPIDLGEIFSLKNFKIYTLYPFSYKYKHLSNNIYISSGFPKYSLIYTVHKIYLIIF